MVKKVILRSLLGLLTLIVLVLFLVPRIGRVIVQNNSENWIGRKVSIDKIRINYLSTTVKIYGFKAYELDGVTNFVSFDTLIANSSLYQIMKGRIVSEKFLLSGLKGQVVKEDSNWNFNSIVEHIKANKDPNKVKDTTKKKKKFEFYFEKIVLRNWSPKYVDSTEETEFSLDSFNLYVPYFSLNTDSVSHGELYFKFRKDGQFNSVLNYNFKRGDFIADINISDFELEEVLDYVQTGLNISGIEGKLNTDINVKGNVNDIKNLSAKGSLGLKNTFFLDSLNNKVFSLKNIDISLDSIIPLKNKYFIDVVSVRRPYFDISLVDTNSSFLSIFRNNEEIDSLSTKLDSTLMVNELQLDTLLSPKDTLELVVNKFVMNNARIDYSDNATKNEVSYKVSNLMMLVDSISNKNKDWIDVDLKFVINKKATFSSNISYLPTKALNLKFDFILDNLLFNDITNYSEYYTGYPAEEGLLTLKSNTRIINYYMNSKNVLFIQKPKLGKKVEGENDVPLKTAFYILKDYKNDVTMDLPIKGDLSDPNVNIGKIIFKTFGNIILRIITLPGKMFTVQSSDESSSERVDLDMIEFNFSDTTLNEIVVSQLKKIIEIDKNKSKLNLNILYPEFDKDEILDLAYHSIGEKYLKETGEDYKQDTIAFKNYLLEKTKNKKLSIPEACYELSNKKSIEKQSSKLIKQRVKTMQDFLRKYSPSSEIKFLIDNQIVKSNNEKVQFKIYYFF